MNYPNGKKQVNIVKRPTKMATKAHLGMDFEDMIIKSSNYYNSCNKALIYKKPTPVKIVKVDYPSRNKAKIVEAYYQIPSTTDFNGIYRGKYIDFEAKSCNGSSFSFNHIYAHQIEHLRKVTELGGISFLLILFNDYQEVFMLKTTELVDLYKKALEGGRKSISYQYFKENAVLVKFSYQPELLYLDAVDKLFF